MTAASGNSAWFEMHAGAAQEFSDGLIFCGEGGEVLGFHADAAEGVWLEADNGEVGKGWRVTVCNESGLLREMSKWIPFLG
ncbi:hypothetical protein [Neisseria musculi]|uniref:hypothetical protein n=1 Tax=Neisseria musculi TaxID=1815583 RepID=UPI00164B7ACB|nr:hypothetical protein [Neisseria musculi]